MTPPKKYDKLDTKFGVVTVLERSKDSKTGKRTIMVLIDDDITATFNEDEFMADFVLREGK